MATIPFHIPMQYLAQVQAGEIIRYGAILKNVETGQIVAHLQQSGIFFDALSSVGQVVEVTSKFASPLSALVETGGVIATMIQNHQISGKLDVLAEAVQSLQVMNLVGTVASVAGIGVSVAGTGLVLRQIKTLDKRIEDGFDRLEDKLDGLPDTLNSDRLSQRLKSIETQLERLQEVPTRKDPRSTVEQVEREMHEGFNDLLNETSRLSVCAEIDADLLHSLLAGLAVSNAAQIKSLVWLDEKETARDRAQRQAHKLMDLADMMPLDVLLKKMPSETERAPVIHSDLSELRAVAVSQAPLCARLIQLEIAGPQYLKEAEERLDAPVLCLPAE